MADAPAAEPRVFFVAPKDETDHATEIPLGFTFGFFTFKTPTSRWAAPKYIGGC